MISMSKMARIAFYTIFVLNEMLAQLSFIEVVQLVWSWLLWLGSHTSWAGNCCFWSWSAVWGRIKFKLGKVLGHSTLKWRKKLKVSWFAYISGLTSVSGSCQEWLTSWHAASPKSYQWGYWRGCCGAQCRSKKSKGLLWGLTSISK